MPVKLAMTAASAEMLFTELPHLERVQRIHVEPGAVGLGVPIGVVVVHRHADLRDDWTGVDAGIDEPIGSRRDSCSAPSRSTRSTMAFCRVSSCRDSPTIRLAKSDICGPADQGRSLLNWYHLEQGCARRELM